MTFDYVFEKFDETKRGYWEFNVRFVMKGI